MSISNEKIQKLMEIAKLYYMQDKTQSEIAKIYQVSRPLVSRMLKEAKEYGIVNIEIRSPLEGNSLVISQLHNLFNIRGGLAIPNGSNDNITNDAIVKAAIDYMADMGLQRYGIGWGHIIGNLITYMESQEQIKGLGDSICPLIGNSGVGNRNYHSNELVRIFALQTGASAEYLYAPAFIPSEQELNLLKELENYKTVYSAWEQLDVALVNIGNYPSTPDFASAARFGNILAGEKAVGRLLGYYFDIGGNVIHSDTDHTLQIPLKVLSRSKQVIGICSSNTKPQAIIGALRTGLINHIIGPENTMKAVICYFK